MAQEELERYREYLKFLAKNNRPDIFRNENTAHAATVLTLMFNHASYNAIMLCHKLSEDIFTEEYKTAFKSFIDGPGHSMKIMVKSDDDCHQGFFGELLAEKKDIEIRVISREAINEISQSTGYKDCDFAVFDGKMFRFEYNATQRESIGSFNDEEIASTLTHQFDSHFGKARPCKSIR